MGCSGGVPIACPCGTPRAHRHVRLHHESPYTGTSKVRDDGGVRDGEAIDTELRLVAALRRAAPEAGHPLPDVAVADHRLDERADLCAGLSPSGHDE